MYVWRSVSRDKYADQHLILRVGYRLWAGYGEDVQQNQGGI
jgi:hypothetical protein